MKIAHLAETLPGGPATYLNELLSFQVPAYTSVYVLAPEGQEHEITVPGTNIITFPKTQRSPAGIFSLWKHVTRILNSLDVDVLHLHSSFAGLVGRLLPTPRIPTVYCAHGWSFPITSSKWKRQVFRLTECALSIRTDAIINISEDEARLALSAGIPQQKCVMVYNGIRDASWSPLTPGLTARKLLFVGRYDQQKGLDILLDAMRTLQPAGFGLTTIGGPIIGKPSITEMPATIANLGWQSPTRIIEEMEKADAVIVPSRWEGFGLVAAEAMRAGRPVVAASVGGLRELIVHAQTGVLCNPNSATDLAEGIMSLRSYDLSALGKNARDRYSEHFSAARMFQQIDQLYSRITDLKI